MNNSNDNYHYHLRVQRASTLFHSLYLWFYLWFTSTYLFCVSTHDLSKLKTVFSENSNFDFFSIIFFPSVSRLCLGEEDCRERKNFGFFWTEFQLLGGTCKISWHKVLESRYSSFKRWFVLSMFPLVLCCECCKFCLIAVGLAYSCCYQFQRIWL